MTSPTPEQQRQEEYQIGIDYASPDGDRTCAMVCRSETGDFFEIPLDFAEYIRALQAERDTLLRVLSTIPTYESDGMSTDFCLGCYEPFGNHSALCWVAELERLLSTIPSRPLPPTV